EDPVHRVMRAGDEAVERHRPVHDHLAGPAAGVAHSVLELGCAYSLSSHPPSLATHVEPESLSPYARLQQHADEHEGYECNHQDDGHDQHSDYGRGYPGRTGEPADDYT